MDNGKESHTETEDLFNDGLDHIFMEMQEPILDAFDDGMDQLFLSIEEPSLDAFDDGMDEHFLNVEEPHADMTETKARENAKSLGIPSFFLCPVNDTQPQARQLFPGPAGVMTIDGDSPNLPPRKQRCSIKKIQTLMKPEVCGNQKVNASITDNDCASVLQDSNKAWLGLMKELKLKITEPGSLLHLFNINWIKTHANKLPDNEKIPFVAGVLEDTLSEKLYTKNTSKLTDHSGSIFVFLDDSFLDAFKEIAIQGTCLVLRNCRLYHERSKNRTCLLVLKKNVWFIATLKETKPFPIEYTDPVSRKTFPCTKILQNDIHVIQNGPWKPEMLLEEYGDIMNAMKTYNGTRVKEPLNERAVLDGNFNDSADDDEAFARAINEIDFGQFDISM